MDNEESIFDDCDSTECEAHNRIDVDDLDATLELYYGVTYVGDYVVYTDDHPAVYDKLTQLIWNKIHQDDGKVLPRWMTRVLKVGKDGLLLEHLKKDQQTEVLWFQEYTEFDVVWDAHHMIVDAIENDMLDLSSPALSRKD